MLSVIALTLALASPAPSAPPSDGARVAAVQARIRALTPDDPAQLSLDLANELQLERELAALPATSNGAPQLPASPGEYAAYYAAPWGVDSVAVYVPQPDARDRYGVVLLLHGLGETETDVVARALFRQLADRTHAILVAPYAGGTRTWTGTAATAAMAALALVRSAYPVDPHRVYLAGISNGGYGVFRIANDYADRFAGFLSVLGALDPHDAPRARQTLRGRNVYLVSGADDPVVTPALSAYTYAQLALACIGVSRYVAPDAGHDLYATAAQTQQAWSDMFAGIVRNDNALECSPGVE